MRCQGGRADAMLLERWVKHEDSSRVTSDRSPFQPLGGGCMCERVRFEIAEPLLGALYCHCKRCQRRTGSAFSVTAATAPGSFKIVQGAELVGPWRPPDGWEKFFCTECGSQLYTTDPEQPERLSVRNGARQDGRVEASRSAAPRSQDDLWPGHADGPRRTSRSEEPEAGSDPPRIREG